MQIYRISLKKEGSPRDFFLTFRQPLHLCSHYHGQGKKLNEKDCRCPTLEAVRVTVEYNFLKNTTFQFSSSQEKNIFLFIYLLHPRLVSQQHFIWIKASHEFALWLNLRPSWFANENKSSGPFHLNFSHTLILTFTPKLSILTFFHTIRSCHFSRFGVHWTIP